MPAHRILIATMPLDGHVNPLTGLAVYLQNLGHDVRWYTGPSYAHKLAWLGIPHFPYRHAREVNQQNLDTEFPERLQLKGTVRRLRFDLNNVFFLRAPELWRDVCVIREEFAFDLLLCDAAFTAAPLVKRLLQVPVVAIGIGPLGETSRVLPPNGLGLVPAATWPGRCLHGALRQLMRHVLLKTCTDTFNQALTDQGLAPTSDFVFDTFTRDPDLYLQSGTPGFEYARPDLSANVRFVGPLLPYRAGSRHPFRHAALARRYERVVLVTQGTVERDSEKLLVPTLEAFADDARTLVVATTGGSQTAALRARFPQANVIIENFIDFDSVMPHAHVYVTNGGYGGTLLALQHQLPLVVAGVHEGKNEIAARVGYFQVGLNLKTETPTPAHLRRAVEQVLRDTCYRANARRLGTEFGRYDANRLCAGYLVALLAKTAAAPVPA